MGACNSTSVAIASSEKQQQPRVAKAKATLVLSLDNIVHHNRMTGDCLVVLRGHVFDLTDFAKRHPGGASVIQGLAEDPMGGDKVFNVMHDDAVLSKIGKCMLGPLVDSYGMSFTGFMSTRNSTRTLLTVPSTATLLTDGTRTFSSSSIVGSHFRLHADDEVPMLKLGRVR